MKLIHLLTLGMCTFTFICHSTPSQSTAKQLSAIQATLDGLINQSNATPDSAAELIELTNIFIAMAKNSNEQELQDLQGAAHINCLLEGSSAFFSQSTTTTPATTATTDLQALNSLTVSARSNTLQKLILASTKNLFTDSHYTNPYIESIGYIANEWLFNSVLSSSISNVSSSALGSNPLFQTVVSRIITGIIATYVWAAQKKLFFSSSIPATATKYFRRIQQKNFRQA